jgi:hypothetical protein
VAHTHCRSCGAVAVSVFCPITLAVFIVCLRRTRALTGPAARTRPEHCIWDARAQSEIGRIFARGSNPWLAEITTQSATRITTRRLKRPSRGDLLRFSGRIRGNERATKVRPSRPRCWLRLGCWPATTIRLVSTHRGIRKDDRVRMSEQYARRSGGLWRGDAP